MQGKLYFAGIRSLLHVSMNTSTKFTSPILNVKSSFYSTETEKNPPREVLIHNLLKEHLDATHLRVVDVSGGCGASFQILVASPKFNGLSMVKQHRMVYDILQKEMKTIHGLSLHTKTPQQIEQELQKAQ